MKLELLTMTFVEQLVAVVAILKLDKNDQCFLSGGKFETLQRLNESFSRLKKFNKGKMAHQTLATLHLY